MSPSKWPVTCAFLLTGLIGCAGSTSTQTNDALLPKTSSGAISLPISQSAKKQPHNAITEIAIPPSFGTALGGIAVSRNNSSVYLSLSPTSANVGARFRGSFTGIPLADPTTEDFATGPVAVTSAGKAFFAVQTHIEDSATPRTGLQGYKAGVSSLGGEDSPLATIGDIASDGSGNIWYAINGGTEPAPIAIKQNGAYVQIASAQLGTDPGAAVSAIAVEANGRAWFAVAPGPSSPGYILYRLSPSGTTLGTFSVPPGTTIGGAAVDAHHRLWFTDPANNTIVRFNGSAFTSYLIPTVSSGVDRITRGVGGMWFTETNSDKIGFITAGGAVTEYAVPTANARPEGIAGNGTAGCDPTVIWFVEQATSKIGEISP